MIIPWYYLHFIVIILIIAIIVLQIVPPMIAFQAKSNILSYIKAAYKVNAPDAPRVFWSSIISA